MSDEEFWSQTFYETALLTERWRIQQAREDRRAALAAWVLASVHRDTEQRGDPFEFQEVVAWLGHGFDRHRGRQSAVPEPPTPDDLLERVKLLNDVYGGTTVNGTG